MFYPHKTEQTPYLDPFSLKVDELSAEQINFFSGLNRKLTAIELQIKRECILLIEDGKRRVNDPNDWISDFEINCSVQFYLSENDPTYNQESDNTLAELVGVYKEDDWSHGIADGKNHRNSFNELLKEERHCSLFYLLIEITPLGLANILRIQNIWIDVNLTYQSSCSV